MFKVFSVIRNSFGHKQFSKYYFVIGSSRSKAKKCRSGGYRSLMGRLYFLKKCATLINFETYISLIFVFS